MMANLRNIRFQLTALLLCLSASLVACATPAANQSNNNSNTSTPSASPSPGSSSAPTAAPTAAPSTGGDLSKSQYLALLACFKASLGNSASALNAVAAHEFQVNSMTDAQFTQNLATVFGSSVKNYQDKASKAGCK
jgi:hypothetical protein